jgi:hypothetical protein
VHEFQVGSQENAKRPCSGQASPGNCLLQRRGNQNLYLEPLLKLKVNSHCTKLRIVELRKNELITR